MGVTRFGLQVPRLHLPGRRRPRPVRGCREDRDERGGVGFRLAVGDGSLLPDRNGRAGQPTRCSRPTRCSPPAARTSKLSLGTLVTGVTYRNPALLAKQVTTLDVISAGRAILGIGAAWNDEEHAGYGFEFPPISERFDRLEEALEICRAMFTQPRPSFTGSHYRIDQALNVPRPIRPDGIPILVGGSGERRTLPLVARYADACNLFGDVATIRHKLDVLERHCEAIGRDPARSPRPASDRS